MALDFDFFSIDPSHSTPAKGSVLVSEPFLGDQYFKRSVVFLTEHNEEGTVGFVLNKPVNLKVQEVIKDFPEVDSVVALGGPVATNTVHYIHTLGELIPNSVHVFETIYWGGDFEVLKNLMASGVVDETKIRFFIGYSGWAPKQLEQEIGQNSWVITRLNPTQIMENRSLGSWKEALNRLGQKYKLWTNFPEKPDLN